MNVLDITTVKAAIMSNDDIVTANTVDFEDRHDALEIPRADDCDDDPKDWRGDLTWCGVIIRGNCKPSTFRAWLDALDSNTASIGEIVEHGESLTTKFVDVRLATDLDKPYTAKTGDTVRLQWQAY